MAKKYCESCECDPCDCGWGNYIRSLKKFWARNGFDGVGKDVVVRVGVNQP